MLGLVTCEKFGKSIEHGMAIVWCNYSKVCGYILYIASNSNIHLCSRLWVYILLHVEDVSDF